MEENNTSTMANLWLSETTFYKKNFYKDYITNPKKRIQTGTAKSLGLDWWNNYVKVYNSIIESKKLIFRAKLVSNDSVTLYQIYDSKQTRDLFQKDIDFEIFYQQIGKPHINEYSISQSQCVNLIENIKNNKSILQFVRKDFQTKGMTIGDPLKGSTYNV